ncbi:MAG: hypothetical protein EA416_12285 [Trueperaceae bacterium]|nr:MAG: hypothetical protein EA416_12285 [Trueperaceae bacterium]
MLSRKRFALAHRAHQAVIWPVLVLSPLIERGDGIGRPDDVFGFRAEPHAEMVGRVMTRVQRSAVGATDRPATVATSGERSPRRLPHHLAGRMSMHDLVSS